MLIVLNELQPVIVWLLVEQNAFDSWVIIYLALNNNL